MNLEAIYHRSLTDMCCPEDKDRLNIKLQTGKDITAVYLHFSDPMMAEMFGHPWEWKGSRIPFTSCRATRTHLWWNITVLPAYKRCAYFFEIHSGEEVIYLFEDHFYKPEEIHLKGRKLQCFVFPWMNPSDIPTVPDWVRTTCWYQIFPDRFFAGDDTLPKPALSDRNKKVISNSDFFGGDLAGITQKLPWLADLGITGLYLTPIFRADTCHKYDTLDYYCIDPAFGDTAALKELTAQAHSLGIRVMLDGVFNHTSYLFPFWQDVLEKGPDSEYFDWFMVNKWPFDKEDPWCFDGKFYTFHFTAFMPKLNTNNPATAEYLIQACEHWVKECDIDGLRLDVANEVAHSFLKKLRTRMHLLKPDFFLLGEIWNDSMMWLMGDEMDSVMDYPFRDTLLCFLKDKTISASDLYCDLNHTLYRYPAQIQRVLFHMLDSHDTERLFTTLEENPPAYAQALVLLYTLPGSPCIYYGSEIPLPGATDPDCRRPMPWDKADSGSKLFGLIQNLTALKRTHPAVSEGTLGFPGDLPGVSLFAHLSGKVSEASSVFSGRMPFDSTDACPAEHSRVLAFRRDLEDDHVLVYINAGDSVFPLPEGTVYASDLAENNVLLPGGFCILLQKTANFPEDMHGTVSP